MIHKAVADAAIWEYLHQLLQLLQASNDKICRGIILQELSNVCHLEYGRVRKTFKRFVQTRSGSKYFKRVSGVYDNGIARVAMKINPERLTRDNPQLHYMLRLCQAETSASEAVTWIKKIDDLHRSHPVERDNMKEMEYEGFSDLAVIAAFIQSLRASLPLPSINLKKGQIYGARSKDLGLEIDLLKTEIDLADFAVPIDCLKESDMAKGALNALDQFIIAKTGTKMGFLYQDLIDECASDIQDCFHQQKAKLGQNEGTKLATATSPLIDLSIPEILVQERRQKEKTRPVQSSVYEITMTTATSAQQESVEIGPVFRVKQDTLDIFSVLFSKSKSRGSIAWTAFEAAMADLKFSVIPKYGSVFTFFPPEDAGVQKSITLHRPHKSRIEGHVLLIFARRLERVYGWGEDSFQVA